MLDLGLPRLHGRDVLADMAAHGLMEQVPVIVVTGEATEGLDALGIRCVLTKPVTSEALRDAVERCLSRFRGQS